MADDSRLGLDVQVNLRVLLLACESLNSEWQIYGCDTLMKILSEQMGFGDVEIRLSEKREDEGDASYEKNKIYESFTRDEPDDLQSQSHTMHYNSGPVKQYNRSREKIESEYYKEEYPQSSRLIDLIRCSITVHEPRHLVQLIQSILQHAQQREEILATDGQMQGMYSLALSLPLCPSLPCTLPTNG